MQHRLGGADRDDGVGLDERPVDASVPSPDVDEVGILRVVDRHLAAEAQREVGRDEALDHAPARPPGEPGRDEQGLALGRDADPLELVRGGGDRRLARVARGAGDRERGRLDEDRRPAAARDERLERLAREREPQRVADGGADVGDRLPRRRGRRDRDGALAAVDDDEPRAVEERERALGDRATISRVGMSGERCRGARRQTA